MARVISGLSSRSMRHSVICLKGRAHIADRMPGQTDIYCMDSRPNELALPFRILKLIRKIRPTVIHARNWGAWPDVALARLVCRPVVPLIFSFHGLAQAGYMPLRRRLASAVLGRITNCLFAVDEPSKRMLVSKWYWPRDKTRVIQNGVDTQLFRPSERQKGPKRVVIGNVGNLNPIKNQALLVRAAAELAAGQIDLELRIAGQGEQRDNLTELAQTVGLGDRLRLLGHVDDIAGFLGELDVFVLCSKSEGHPNALLEAMACGLPCVATRLETVEDVLDNGECGLMVEPEDKTSMIEAISAILRDPELARRLGSAARKSVCDRYGMDRMLEAYAELYTRLSSR